MFTIHHGAENLSVIFKSVDILRLGKHGFEDCEQISCAILGKDNRPKGVGMAIRSESDAPNDFGGMALALERALNRLTRNFTHRADARALRAKFWNAYYNAVEQELELDAANETDYEFVEPEPLTSTGAASTNRLGYADQRDESLTAAGSSPVTTGLFVGFHDSVRPSNVVPFVNPRIKQIEESLAVCSIGLGNGCSVCVRLTDELMGILKEAA